jgi:hypothetical protein
MKIKKAAWLLTCFFFMGLSLFSEEPLNQEWAKMDIALFREIFPLFASPFSFAEYEAVYKFQGSLPSGDSKDLGLGYSIERLSRYGGYTTIRCALIVDGKQRVCRGRIDIDSDVRVVALLREKYALDEYFSIRPGMNPDGSSLSYAFTDEATYRSFIRAFEKHFGVKNYGKYLKSENNFLFDPLTEDVFGRYVGEAGTVPRSRDMIAKMNDGKNKKPLEDLLISINPESRIYALEALMETYDVDIYGKNKYSKTIQKIIELKAPVTIGSGCIIWKAKIESREDILKAIGNQ